MVQTMRFLKLDVAVGRAVLLPNVDVVSLRHGESFKARDFKAL